MEVQGADQHSTSMAPDYCRGCSYVRAVGCYVEVQFVADRRQDKVDDKGQQD